MYYPVCLQNGAAINVVIIEAESMRHALAQAGGIELSSVGEGRCTPAYNLPGPDGFETMEAAEAALVAAGIEYL